MSEAPDTAGGGKPARGEGALSLTERARRTSRRLKHMASVVQYRAAFTPDAPARTPAGEQPLTRIEPARLAPLRRAGAAASRSLLWTSALLCVALPTLLGAIYYAFLASDQYVSEVRMAIRSMDQKSRDSIGSMLANPLNIGAPQTDLHLVGNFLNSREMVDRLQRELDLKALYARSSVDFLSRLQANATIDDLVEYWRKMLAAGVDAPSGVLTVEVRAFAPQEALDIARIVVSSAEGLVNGMSQRAYRDAVSFSEQELKRTEERLAQVRAELGAYRDKVGVLNPAQTADVTVAQIAKLRDERLRLDQELAARRGLLANNSPVLVDLRTRAQTLDSQIASLQSQLTAREREQKSDPALSAIATKFDELNTEAQFAQKSYEAALTNVEKARADAQRQHFFIVPFVEPKLAEAAKYPRRLLNSFLVLFGSFALWAIGALAVASVRDHAG